MPEAPKKKPPAKINGGKFELQKKLGAGCFGEVYRGLNTESGEEVAVKTEDVHARSPQLQTEAELLKFLREPTVQQGFVECFFYGMEGGFNVLVMELLGKSIEDMVQKCGGKFTAKTTTLVAEQVIMRIEYLHSKGIVHRDIKPENFMFGIKNRVHHVYLIDFGLSKKYWDVKHSVMRTKLSLTGTARYASINAHKGVEQSRRDDLEAIGHMILYFLRGAMPWSGLDAKTQEEKYRKIKEKKEQFPLNELCAGFPPCFEEYLRYTRNLEFTQRPDYDMLIEQFRACRKSEGAENDWDYQWFDGKPPDNPVPLVPRVKIPQPDDPKSAGAKRRGFCFCGGSAVKE